MIYFSHRGANTQYVQNTVAAFARAHQLGARYFELDVHLLKDGQLAVHHDASLLSTAGVDIKLADLDTAALKQITLKNPFGTIPTQVPLLEEVLPVIEPGLILLNIELKNEQNIYPGIEQTLLQQLPAHLLPHILFSSFDYPTLLRLRQLDPKARIGQLTRSFDVQEAISLRAESVHINHTRFSTQIAQQCHAQGLKVYCYTVNDKLLADRLATEGADGIFTDNIELFIHSNPPH